MIFIGPTMGPFVDDSFVRRRDAAEAAASVSDEGVGSEPEGWWN